MSNSKMIVVSNRLPFVLKRESENGDLSRKSSAGGLVTAVAPVVVQCDGKYYCSVLQTLNNSKICQKICILATLSNLSAFL